MESAREYVLSMQENTGGPRPKYWHRKQCGNVTCDLTISCDSAILKNAWQKCEDLSKHPEEKSILKIKNTHVKRLKQTLRAKMFDLDMKRKAVDSVKEV